MNTARLHAAVFEPIAEALDSPVYRRTLRNLKEITPMNDPHDREYLAAAAGLHEQTPRPCQLPAVGDFVSGCTAGKRWSGYVQKIEPRRMVVEADGAWLVVDPADITH